MSWRDDAEHLEGWFDLVGRTIAVDFDGTLHPYTAGWVGSIPADEPPIAGAPEFLAKLDELGFRIVVFSARADHQEGADGISAWLADYGLLDLVDEITNKKVAAIAYVDDRAVNFRGDWDAVLLEVDRLADGRPHGAASFAND